MATRDEVAKLAGVSPATVSNVLTGRKYVSPELTQKIQWAVKELNYTPNLLARALVTSRSYQLALLVHEIANPYYSEIAEGMEEVAKAHGYSVSFFIVDEWTDECFDTIRQRHYDGIFSLATTNFSEEQKQYFLDNHIAFCSAGSNALGSSVQLFYKEAANRAMAHLAAYGHENIAFISGFEPDIYDERFDAYSNFVTKTQKQINARYLRFGGYPKYKSFDLGYRYTREIMDSCPEVTAIFAYNDLMAYGAIRAIRDMGMSVPEDVSVIGCDDIFTSGLLNPALTTISVNKADIGRNGARLLIEQIETGKAQNVFETAGLIVRDSVGKKKGKP